MNLLTTLRAMLTFCRPAGSATEAAFIDKYVMSLPGAYKCFGNNIVVQIGDSPVLFSCHTDTVHRQDGYQTIHESDGIARLSQRSLAAGRNCLGADDTAGVWLCREMVLAGILGTYIFHYGEERGGIGSSALADNTVGAGWLSGFKYAIAFDRRGHTDIITHQAYGRTASDLFATALALMFDTVGLSGYIPCSGGIFTDTANYSGLIGECSNVSVGYANEHTIRESLDLSHVLRLRNALVAVDWSQLTGDRLPGTDDDGFEDDWGWLDKDDDGVVVEDETVDTPSVNWRYLDRDTSRSYRLDPEYDDVQRQLTIDLLKYRSNRTH